MTADDGAGQKVTSGEPVSCPGQALAASVHRAILRLRGGRYSPQMGFPIASKPTGYREDPDLEQVEPE